MICDKIEKENRQRKPEAIIQAKGIYKKEIRKNMVKTALELTPEEWQIYQPLAVLQERQKKTAEQTEKRWRQACRVAGEAAMLLRKEFGASRVVLFGSAAHRSWFTGQSDIDLAVWGIAPERFFAAVAAMTGFSADFQIDLVDPESCSPTLRSIIERDGIDL